MIMKGRSLTEFDDMQLRHALQLSDVYMDHMVRRVPIAPASVPTITVPIVWSPRLIFANHRGEAGRGRKRAA